MKILIVDDEIELLALFKEVLEDSGHRVETAIDGETGLDLFRTAIETGESFDMIVMDYRMYGKDGLSTSQKIYAMDNDVKILFASADGSMKRKVLQMGAVGFLLKPFDIDKFVQEIER
jgi:DNA-binding response OmpR family regulator